MATTEVNVSPFPPQPLLWLGSTGPRLNSAPKSAHSPPGQFPRPAIPELPNDPTFAEECSAYEIPNLRIVVFSEP
jgi:hypothetical protein